MSLNINTVHVAGNLTRNPETKKVGENIVCNFGLAINRKYKDREETVFCEVECWNRQAETVGQYLIKGRNCYIDGELGFSSWEKDGQKRSKLFIRAHRVHFIGGLNEGNNDNQPAQQPVGSVSNAMSQNDKAGDTIEDEPPF